MQITILDIKKQYAGQIDHLDLELLIANTLKKPREFVLAHPECLIPSFKIKNLKFKITRRMRGEPLAYILGSREFFGLPFLVSPATLIPRPETEMMVEEALQEIQVAKQKNFTIIDVGTGSGNIIISVTKSLESFCHSRAYGDPVARHKVSTLDSRIHGNDIKFYGIDFSTAALRVARRNAKINNVDKKINFLHGDILEPFLKNTKYKILDTRYIILANLPYLSKKIYAATAPTVKKFEPKSALYSANDGLAHYEKLFKQIKFLQANKANKLMQLAPLTAILEFSPEQKNLLQKLILKYFPKADILFKKDLAGRTRMAIMSL